MTVYGEKDGKEFSAAKDIDANLIESNQGGLNEMYWELCHSVQCHTLQDYSLDYDVDYTRVFLNRDGWGFWDKNFHTEVTGYTLQKEAVEAMKEYDAAQY